MAATMQFDLVSPERRLLSVAASAVNLPGTEGDLTVMPNHAPLITTLRPGILKVDSAEGEKTFVVTGGFAEINAETATVLAEQAVPVGEIDQATYNAMVAEARAAHEGAKDVQKNEPGAVDEAAKLVADMVAVGGHINLTAPD